MILTCPKCATRYQTDEAKFLPAGRLVRCAKCSHIWHQAGPAADPQLPPAPIEDFILKDTTVAVAAPPCAAVRPRLRTVVAKEPNAPWLPRLALAAGWIALGAIVLLVAFSAVRYRQDIATAWPQSASLYSLLGLNLNQRGVDLTRVTYSLKIEDGQSVLAVTGSIVNSADRELPVPQTIRVTLSDAANRELYHWTFTPGVQTLGPGKNAPFQTRLSSPPSGARHLEIRFDGP